jgi:Nucleotidyl transferase AbiEii toxin, Type IV TA system
MPQEEDVLGFSNLWFQHAIETAIERELPSGARIRAASPPAIVATKLAAWKRRGKGDLLRSLDLHDVLVLVDGRLELTSELAQEPAAVRAYIATELKAIMEDEHFRYLAESAMQPYGALGGERADRLVELTAALTQALD